MLLVTAAADLAALLGEPIQQWVWSLLGCGLLIAAATDLIRQGSSADAARGASPQDRADQG